MRFRILFISGCPDDARHLSRMLRPLRVELHHAKNLQQARDMLRKSAYRLILTEANLTDGAWLDVVQTADRHSIDLPVIVTDPQADARLWSEVLNQGGYDLLTQPFYAPEVRRILENAATRTAGMAAV
jgi:DNA-binding NtrC family response regulator